MRILLRTKLIDKLFCFIGLGSCYNYLWDYVWMRKLKKLNDTVREYNGLIARVKRANTEENKKLLEDVLSKLKAQVDEALNDQD